MTFRNYTDYEVFEDGRIWSYKKNRFLKPGTTRGGYQQVFLTDNDGKSKWYYIHRVVYESVTRSQIQDCFECNHKNEDKTDNRFENINILTPKENCNWGTRNSRIAKAQSKKVGAFNKNCELVITFKSTQEASRNGFNKCHISECCNGKRKTHKGYTWKYI